MPKISKIYLYDEPSIPEIQIYNQAKFLEQQFRIRVEIRKNILHLANSSISKKISSCRIFDIKKPFQIHEPTDNEVLFEHENMVDTTTMENIIMYDGIELQNTYHELILPSEDTLNDLHIIFTNKFTCTFDYSDYRYHGRAIIGSNPSIISITGILEAPAKPKEYYMELISSYRYSLNINSLKEKFRGQFLEPHDKRLEKVIEGYLLQAVFYHITGEAFCDSPECRLFNAHWQKELIHSQIVGKLCKKHQDVIS